MKIQDNIASEFNEFSKNYTKDMIGCVPYYQELIGSISKSINPQFKAEKILDLGCGNGNSTGALIKRFPRAEYTLVDASSEMLELCRSLFSGSKINTVECYFKDFDFDLETYDIVVAGFSLHHCQSDEKKYLFSQIFSSLRSGGFFSMSDLMISKENPDHGNLLNKWEDFVNQNFPSEDKWSWLMDHYNTFDSPDNYTDQILWLKNSGFNEITTPFRESYWTHLVATKN